MHEGWGAILNMNIRELKRGDGRGNMKEMRGEAKQTSGGRMS